jgi:hypothetical protein
VDSVVFQNVDPVPRDDAFFTQASFRGAFGGADSDVWIDAWTWLAAHNGLGKHLPSQAATITVAVDSSVAEKKHKRPLGLDDRSVVIAVGVLVPAAFAVFVGMVFYYVRFKRVESKYQELISHHADVTAIRGHHERREVGLTEVNILPSVRA